MKITKSKLRQIIREEIQNQNLIFEISKPEFEKKLSFFFFQNKNKIKPNENNPRSNEVTLKSIKDSMLKVGYSIPKNRELTDSAYTLFSKQLSRFNRNSINPNTIAKVTIDILTRSDMYEPLRATKSGERNSAGEWWDSL